MKAKVFIFMMLIGFCMRFTSCSMFDCQPNIKIIGSGFVQNDKGTYFVEIDSMRYALADIYTNSSNQDKKNTIKPVEGMLITAFQRSCFTLSEDTPIEFIVGTSKEEYLQEYFTTNLTIYILWICFIIFGLIFVLCIDKVYKTRIVHADL